ncbi:hypothetical protein AAVH_27805 [Aphelenchoides avenae]|nr:hypothetical protein AAVH_27805 [Aphelenchus avenae]
MKRKDPTDSPGETSTKTMRLDCAPDLPASAAPAASDAVNNNVEPIASGSGISTAIMEPKRDLLANETLVDVFSPLDRHSLHHLRISNRRFQCIVEDRMNNVCLRQIKNAWLKGDLKRKYSAFLQLAKEERCGERKINEMRHDTSTYETILVWIFDALRQSVVMEELMFRDVLMGPVVKLVEKEDFAIRVLGSFSLRYVSSWQDHGVEEILDAFTEVHTVDLAKSGMDHRASDDLLYKCVSKSVKRLLLQQEGRGGLHSDVSEEAILDFCFRKEPESDNEKRELRIGFQWLTGAFFGKLVEASRKSKETNRLILRINGLTSLPLQDTKAYEECRVANDGTDSSVSENCRRFDFTEPVRFHIFSCHRNALEIRRGKEPETESHFFKHYC